MEFAAYQMQELVNSDEHGKALGSTKDLLCDIEVGPLSSPLSAPMKQLNGPQGQSWLRCTSVLNVCLECVSAGSGQQ